MRNTTTAETADRTVGGAGGERVGGGKRGEGSRGARLLAEVMRTRGASVSKLSRDLDRSWGYARRILDGASRPSVDDAAVLREKYGVPVESWRQS